MNVIYSIMISDFVQFLLRVRRRRRHYHHSSGSSGSMSILELIVFLAGAVLVYIAFKTSLIEKITSSELIRTILKIVVTLIGISLIAGSFVLDI
ncbi:MAG: hypothetical protein K2J47_03565 [Ruminococcus sp.]|nr:hypothetical protein [Ruminococcus sp.]